MNDVRSEFSADIHELIRHLMLIEPSMIDRPDIQEATISGKRGIFGEPSYKELTIKIKYMEDSVFLTEKRKQLKAMVDELEAEKDVLNKEIARIDGQIAVLESE